MAIMGKHNRSGSSSITLAAAILFASLATATALGPRGRHIDDKTVSEVCIASPGAFQPRHGPALPGDVVYAAIIDTRPGEFRQALTDVIRVPPGTTKCIQVPFDERDIPEMTEIEFAAGNPKYMAEGVYRKTFPVQMRNVLSRFSNEGTRLNIGCDFFPNGLPEGDGTFRMECIDCDDLTATRVESTCYKLEMRS